MTVVALKRIIPFYIYAVVFSSLSIVVGLIWDISWHTSIGRDGLFSPPHLLIYLGAVTAGIFSGYHVLRVTFMGRAVEKDASIRFWGIFYSSLGALFCIWGAFTMITSAPFDDWWHSTFGLDVEILSPPHTVLLLGMITVQFGAMVSVLAYQNRLATASPAVIKILKWSFTLSAGFMLVMVYTIASEYLGRHAMHSSFFYIVSGLLFPLLLVAVSVASPSRWAATHTAIVYMLVMALLVWILPLFPAEPRLGPVLNHITHYQNFDFPLLLIFPAIAIDWLNTRMEHRNAFIKALSLGALLIMVMLVVQWLMGSFLMSPYARNWVFGTTSWYFGSDPNWEYRYAFAPWNEEPLPVFVKGIGFALLIASVSAWLGLTWGKWMKSVKR
ncbi:MAG: hypothetical protein ACOH2A_06440 [Sphingobacteriaceae bacterium]